MHAPWLVILSEAKDLKMPCCLAWRGGALRPCQQYPYAVAWFSTGYLPLKQAVQ
jgi:hypothetical protein